MEGFTEEKLEIHTHTHKLAVCLGRCKKGEVNIGQPYLRGNQDDSMMTHRQLRTDTVLASDCHVEVVPWQEVGCGTCVTILLPVRQCGGTLHCTQMQVPTFHYPLLNLPDLYDIHLPFLWDTSRICMTYVLSMHQAPNDGRERDGSTFPSYDWTTQPSQAGLTPLP